MIIIPSRGRPSSISRLAFWYVSTHATSRVLVLVDADDVRNYANLRLPPTWTIREHGERAPITEITNRGFRMFPNEETYGVLADDVVPTTDKWDEKLAAASVPHGVAWGDDGYWGVRLPVHMFMGGDLARALGWVSFPQVNAWYADNMWGDLGRALGTAKYLPHVKMEHMHHSYGKGMVDQTYRDAADAARNEADRQAYEAFHSSGEFAKLIAQVRGKVGINA